MHKLKKVSCTSIEMNIQVAIELCIILCNLISIHSNNKTAKCHYQIYGNMYTKMTPVFDTNKQEKLNISIAWYLSNSPF